MTLLPARPPGFRLRAARPCPCAAGGCANSAALGSWVTMTMLLPCSRFSICSRCSTSSADLRSRSPVGSSHTSRVGIGHQRARDRDALSLAAGQFVGLVLGAVGDADQGQRGQRIGFALRGGQMGQQQRQLHIALRAQHRHQVVELEHEADMVGAPARQGAAAELVQALAGDGDFARGRRVQTADQIQQRRLARAARSHQRDEIALARCRGSSPCRTSTLCLPRT